MEIQGKNGSKTLLKEGIEIDFGRGSGLDFDDRTVSRRHISFRLHTSSERKDVIKVGFEVTGKNPIWVRNSRSGEIRVYRSSERGEMEGGDSFCVSAKKPVWFNLKRAEFESRELRFEDELAESLQTSHGLLPMNEDLEIEAGDFANIDPVKEFGFIVMGHEFDSFPKKMIHDSRSWDWFLEEAGDKSDDDDPGKRKRNKGARRKRKKGDGNDDDDWTGESEEDAELITKVRKVQKPKYSTRSKDRDKHMKDTRVSKNSQQKDNMQTDETDTEDEEEDDKDDETLGGFIVDDEGVVGDEEISEAEEEEEFIEEDDEEE